MNSLAQYVNTPQEAPDTKKVEICGLDRPLGDCPLRRTGRCDSLYSVLVYLWPPQSVTDAAKASTDKDARTWLARLDAALPGRRPTFGGGRR